MDRKALVREYLETPRPGGVYGIRNASNGKVLLGSSANLPAILRRERFQLESGLHPDKELQAEWNEFGPSAFAFEALDVLKPPDDPDYDPSEDLRVLKELWLGKLTAEGISFYRRSNVDTRDRGTHTLSRSAAGG